jgi:ABC-type sugar transport system ATPase subunit
MEPRILLLDQPTRGIDIGAKEEIYHLMYMLAQSGVAIVFVATEVTELLRVCNRIYVMRSGSMVAELDGAHCTEQELHLATVGAI